ncbi:hypothetical protein PLEOSDRAFT_170608 [Pleurotus ostreatus PC15]|uniref:Uncharacterized protein n=1 Tax=Pleurotus ostreatus (strain PC15) TaxID=1137138 RepID=A0A067NJH8_PLEO1|nr:hypothetical protein PLEOSDRAFT_170608 [Pleurotus ostreatus PC15]
MMGGKSPANDDVHMDEGHNTPRYDEEKYEQKHAQEGEGQPSRKDKGKGKATTRNISELDTFPAAPYDLGAPRQQTWINTGIGCMNCIKTECTTCIGFTSHFMVGIRDNNARADRRLMARDICPEIFNDYDRLYETARRTIESDRDEIDDLDGKLTRLNNYADRIERDLDDAQARIKELESSQDDAHQHNHRKTRLSLSPGRPTSETASSRIGSSMGMISQPQSSQSVVSGRRSEYYDLDSDDGESEASDTKEPPRYVKLMNKNMSSTMSEQTSASEFPPLPQAGPFNYARVASTHSLVGRNPTTTAPKEEEQTMLPVNSAAWAKMVQAAQIPDNWEAYNSCRAVVNLANQLASNKKPMRGFMKAALRTWRAPDWVRKARNIRPLPWITVANATAPSTSGTTTTLSTEGASGDSTVAPTTRVGPSFRTELRPTTGYQAPGMEASPKAWCAYDYYFRHVKAMSARLGDNPLDLRARRGHRLVRRTGPSPAAGDPSFERNRSTYAERSTTLLALPGRYQAVITWLGLTIPSIYHPVHYTGSLDNLSVEDVAIHMAACGVSVEMANDAWLFARQWLLDPRNDGRINTYPTRQQLMALPPSQYPPGAPNAPTILLNPRDYFPHGCPPEPTEVQSKRLHHPAALRGGYDTNAAILRQLHAVAVALGHTTVTHGDPTVSTPATQLSSDSRVDRLGPPTLTTAQPFAWDDDVEADSHQTLTVSLGGPIVPPAYLHSSSSRSHHDAPQTSSSHQTTNFPNISLPPVPSPLQTTAPAVPTEDVPILRTSNLEGAFYLHHTPLVLTVLEESPKAKHSEITFEVKGSNAGVIFVRRWELGYKLELRVSVAFVVPLLS